MKNILISGEWLVLENLLLVFVGFVLGYWVSKTPSNEFDKMGEEINDLKTRHGLLHQAQADNAVEILQWRRIAHEIGMSGMEPEQVYDKIRVLKAYKEACLSIPGFNEKDIIRMSQLCLVEAQQFEDMIRCIGIIGLSGNPLPPKLVGTEFIPQIGYTAEQHQACVKSCQALMKYYKLHEYRCRTVEKLIPSQV